MANIWRDIGKGFKKKVIYRTRIGLPPGFQTRSLVVICHMESRLDRGHHFYPPKYDYDTSMPIKDSLKKMSNLTRLEM